MGQDVAQIMKFGIELNYAEPIFKPYWLTTHYRTTKKINGTSNKNIYHVKEGRMAYQVPPIYL